MSTNSGISTQVIGKRQRSASETSGTSDASFKRPCTAHEISDDSLLTHRDGSHSMVITLDGLHQPNYSGLNKSVTEDSEDVHSVTIDGSRRSPVASALPESLEAYASDNTKASGIGVVPDAQAGASMDSVSAPESPAKEGCGIAELDLIKKLDARVKHFVNYGEEAAWHAKLSPRELPTYAQGFLEIGIKKGPDLQSEINRCVFTKSDPSEQWVSELEAIKAGWRAKMAEGIVGYKALYEQHYNNRRDIVFPDSWK